MLFFEGSKVGITPEGENLPEVIQLKKREDKDFKDILTYIYFVYSKETIYHNKLPSERRDLVFRDYIGGKSRSKDFEDNRYIRDVIKRYLDLQFTPTELLYNRICKEIEDLLNYISSIPYEKEENIMIDVETEENGEKIIKKKKVRVKTDNSEEKGKALQLAEKLLSYEEKLKSKVMKEISNKKKSSERIFDKY